MSDPIFDLDSWEPLFKLSEEVAVDAKGKLGLRMGENMVMDMESGNMRFTTPWINAQEDEDD